MKWKEEVTVDINPRYAVGDDGYTSDDYEKQTGGENGE